MCGGTGSRLDSQVEKPLVEIDGVPMVEHVLTALDGSQVDTVHAAVSPQAPETTTFLEPRPVACIETPGDGYVEDLGVVLEGLETPVLTVAADLPLVTGAVVDNILDRHDCGPLGVYTPAAVKRALGASVDLTVEHGGEELAPTGINIVSDGEESTHVTYDVRLAVNVNRPEEVAIAEVLA
jgi:adenosylcobinamide-phosphate guanylyltransferase